MQGHSGAVVALSPPSKKVLGSIPAWDAVGAEGVSSFPCPQCLQPRWGCQKGPFCVEFACSPPAPLGFPPDRNPPLKKKHTKKKYNVENSVSVFIVIIN